MGGHVDIESRPGQGTQVRILFPKSAGEPAAATQTPATKTDLTGGEVILVVEDEPGVRAPICRKLRSLGYFVLEADHGEDALKVMQDHHSPVHLVISDVMMPEMDGTELVALLRSWYPRLRVLFISGYSPQYLEAQGGKTVGGEAFLAKPFSLDAFAQRVRDVLDKEWEQFAP
jgi:CheY-like chemotaxis protein